VYPTLESYSSFNYVEINNAKALEKVWWTFPANALVRKVSLVQVHNHLHGCPAERTPTAHGRHRVRTGRAKANTNNQSCQRKRDAVLHCTTLLLYRQCHCSCEMVLQNPVLHFPVLLFPVLHFQRPPHLHHFRSLQRDLNDNYKLIINNSKLFHWPRTVKLRFYLHPYLYRLPHRGCMGQRIAYK